MRRNDMAVTTLNSELGMIVEGRTINDHWSYYTVNVKLLKTMTHEQWCAEFPKAAAIIQRLSERENKLKELLGE
jgi:hypothetical protein